MTTRKVIASLFVGAAAGAVLGILLAPDKGSETRKKISRKGADFADGLKSRFKNLVGGRYEPSELVFEGEDEFDAFEESANYSFH